MDLSLKTVRDFFEAYDFSVKLFHTRPGDKGKKGGETRTVLLVKNEKPVADDARPSFVLRLNDFLSIDKAAVELRCWHTEKFFPSVMGKTGSFHREPGYSTVLVVSSLPAGGTMRSKAIEYISKKGIDHVMEFSTVLKGLLARVKRQKLYPESDVLQLMSLLKTYRLLKEPQGELFR